MSNWWEAYPVVSADDPGIQAMISPQSKATADPKAKSDSQPAGEDNWWEAYPAVRADVGHKAVLAGIEADKKQKEERDRLHEAHQSLETYGEAAHVAGQIVTDTTSLVRRLFGQNEKADQLNRDSATIDQAMRERDATRWQSEASPEGMSTAERAGQYVPFVKQGVRGAARSMGSAFLGAKGAGGLIGTSRVAGGAVTGAVRGAAAQGVAGAATGAAQGAGAAARGVLATGGGSAYGAIALASGQEANQAMTEGADAGLTGSALAGYVASQGLIEAVPATVMQKLGMGGVEAMVAGPAIRGGIKAGIIESIKRIGQELPEEVLLTEIPHAIAAEYSNVDKQALDPDRLSSLVADTVLQTVLMGAGAGAINTALGAAQERLARLQEMRAKGFVSAEDAAKEGIAGKNRKERLANADAEIERLTKEASTPKGQDVPIIGTSEPGLPPTPQGPQPGPTQGPPPLPGQPPRLPGPAGAAETPPPSPGNTPAGPLVTQAVIQQLIKNAAQGTGEQTTQPPDPATPPAAPQPGASQPEGEPPIAEPEVTQAQSQPDWDIIEGSDGKLYRQNPNAKTNQERISTRQPVDPSEGIVLVTKDEFGKAVSPTTLAARQEFVDKAQVGAEFEHKGYQGQSFKVLEGGVLLNSSGRKMGDIQTMANTLSPGDITWKGTPSTAGSSEGTGKTPTGSPTVSSDAPSTPETSMGETGGGKQTSEARADQPRRGNVGDMLAAGEVVTTSSGRATTPFPKIDITSDRKAQNTIKRVDKWLHENAVEEARSRGDDFNLTLFQNEDPANLPPASKDSMEEYLFGEQPPVQKPITKPLVSKPSSADAAESQGTAAPPTSETVDADIDQALGSFKKSYGVEAALTSEDKLSDDHREALDFAKSRGQRLAFVDIAKSDTAPVASFNPDTKIALVSSELKGDKLWGMIGHEMAHQTGLDSILPTDSSELQSMMDEYYQSASPAYRAKLDKDKQQHEREGRARLVQKFFEDKAFRDKLKQSNPTLWDKLREAVLKFIGQWTPKDEAKRLVLDELRAAQKPEKRRGRKDQPGAVPPKPFLPKTPVGMGTMLRDRVVANVQEMYDTKNYSEDGLLATIKRAVDSEFGKLTTEVAERGNITDDVREWINEFDASKFTGSVRAYLNRQEQKPAQEPTSETEEDDNIPPRNFDSQFNGPITGYPFEDRVWRVPQKDGDESAENGIFYAEKEEDAARYARKVGITAINGDIVRLENPIVGYTKESVLEELGIDEYELDQPNEDQDVDHYIDIAIREAAMDEGYDGAIYLSSLHGNGEVHVFEPSQELTQGKDDKQADEPVKVGDLIKSDGKTGVVTRVKDGGVLSVDFEETSASGRKVSPRYSGFGIVRPGEYTVVGPSPFPATLEQFYKQFGDRSQEQVTNEALRLWNSLDEDDKSRFAHRLRRFGIAGAKKNSAPETIAESIANVISKSAGVPGKLREVYDIAMEYPQLNNIFNDPKQLELSDEMMRRIDAVGLSLPPMVRAVLPALPDMRLEVLHELAKQQFGQEIADALFFEEDSEGDTLENLPQAIPAYVISGLQRDPAKIDRQKFTGRPIGVAVGPQRMSDNVIRKIAAHVDRGGTLFVDSGMFGTVKGGKIGEEPNWANVFEEYGRVLDAIKPANRRNVMLVAPDYLVKIETAEGELIIGDPFRTLELQRQHRLSVEELLDQGARVIIPLQRDMSEEPMSLSETASLASENIDLTSGNFAWGIPYNEAAWPDEDILEFIRVVNDSGMHIHLLGGGKARAEKLWEQIKAIDPTVKLTGDAATEARNAYRADKSAKPESKPEESGSISIDDFADIFANPEQAAKPPAEKPPVSKDETNAPPKKKTGRKDPKEGIKEGLDEAKAGADLIRKALKDLGTNFFAGPPINEELARGMGMLANGLIKAGKYKFIEFIDEAVKMLGAPAVRYLGPYLEAGWNKKAETDDRLDQATSVVDILAGKHGDAKTTSAQTRIANRVRDALEKKEELTSQKFFAIADEEFGGTRANNDYGDSQATDALELGVNLYLQGKTKPGSAAYADLMVERIQKVMELVPRHRGRTGNKDLLQQFSTPPAYAYVVNWIANITEDDVVLEPSAGMGGIAIHAANSGAKVYANELDPARADGLRELPLEKVFTEDAEQIGAILKGKIPGLSVIIMNPPFSRAGMRMGDKMVQGTDRKHIDEALTLLPEGGRLVAIVGAGLHGQGQKMTKWLDELPYQLVANIEVARNVYRGYGTEFPTRVLVIDKVPRTDSTLVRAVSDLSELIDVAEEVRNARQPIASVEPDEDQSDSSQGSDEDGQDAGTPDDARDPTDTRVPGDTNSGEGQADDGQRQPDRGDGTDNGNAPGGSTGSNAGGRRGGRGGGGSSRKSGRSGGRSKTKSGGDASSGKSKSGSRGIPDRGNGLTKVTAKSQRRSVTDKTELGESTFENYVPSVTVEGAKPHPAPIVESAAMAAVDAPATNYEVDLAPGVFEGYVNEDGIYVGLSDIQLEAIAMAGAAHEQMLPSGERRGFLIGDGTGVGKAREALGIIMDDFIKRGTGKRRKAVFITKNDGLVKDAVKEWVGVGGDPSEMKPLTDNSESGQSIDLESGVLSLGYDTLKGEASAVARQNGHTLSRIDQIVEWVGEDFDGVIVFDEAHLMANSLDTGAKGASGRGLAGVDIQQRLPNARVVYLSATAATEVRNLAYAERLGLWGAGTAFPSKHAFINEIEAGGVAAMEKVAADMKAMGMYVARNLSYDDGTDNGRVEFDRILHTLTADQRRVYDKLSEAWLKVLADIDTALGITGNERGKARIVGNFWSANQRFWNDVVTTMMAPTLIQNIEKDLAAGRSVVVQLWATKESATNRAIAGMKDGETYDEIDASPRRALMEYVERGFPTQRHEKYIDDSGNERTRPVVDSEGKPVHDPAAVAMKERLLDEIGSLEVAARGPIDVLVDHFGPEMVAEISGRKARLVKGDDGRLEMDTRGKAASRADRDAFMDGKKRILVFSEAGGTGASYHASLSVKNQQRRSHYLWQPGWSAPVAVQGLGRAHRSNQASAPMLHLLEPNLEGYKRFISTIARRLGQLGALTKGQRTAADAGLFGANDNLESTEANRALFQFIVDAVNEQIEGIDRDYLVERLGLDQVEGTVAPTPEMFTITQFLNRLLNLPLGEQNQVFTQFQVRLDNIVAQAIQDGTLDQGMETIKAEKIVKANETIVNEHATGAKTKLVQLTLTQKVKLRTFEDMLHEVASYTQFGLEGFFRSKTSGKVLAVINQNRISQDDKGRTLHDAMAISVDGNTYGHSIEQFEKEQYWEELSRDQAKKLWGEQFEKSPTTRDSTEYLLTGALLPIWNRIPGERSRVVRALTTDGEMILGRVVPERMLQRTLDSLGIAGGERRQYTPQEAIQAVYQGGTVELENGWKIKKRTIDGEDNIEIIGPDYSSKDAIINAGGFSRRIDYTTRFFIPFNDSEGEVLAEITRISPIASITRPSRGGGIAQMANPTRQSRSSGSGAAARVPGEGIAAADIQKTAERLFDVPIKQGNFSQRAAGIYKWLTRRNGPPSPEIVRTAEKHYANIAVVSHEIAHHIDERTKAVNSMPVAVRQEVAKLDYEPQKARPFEGWAEFLRRYMTEPPIDVNGNMVPNPAIDAPQTLKWFEETFSQAHPDVAKAIAEFRKYAQQFANQSVFARIGSMIADRKPQDLNFNERWKQRGKRWVNRLKSNFLDKFHTLNWIQEEAKAKGYKGVGIYDLTMAYFMSASSHATIAFEEGVRSLMTGKQIGKTKLWGLARHLENDGEYDEAIRYALARHTLFMNSVQPGYNTGVDVEDAQAWLDEAESLGKADRYDDFARELAKFNDDLLKMLVDAGALSREDANKMIDYYRDSTGAPNYFPLHRVQDLDKSEFVGTSPGFVNLGKPVKGRSRSGSGRQIVDPIDATITRAIKFYGRAIQARQAHTLAKTLDPLLGGVGGMGGLMDRVPAKRTVHQGTIEEILDTLVASGAIDADMARAMRIAARIRDPGNGLPSQRDLDWFAKKHNIADWTKAWSDMETAAESEPDALAVISLWRPDYTPSAQKRTVMIYDPDGNKLMYELDDYLYQVATGMQDIQFKGFMITLREGSRYFKSGAVGLSTGFGTANLVRDYFEFQGKANYVKGLKTLGKPWEMLGRYIAAKTRQAFPRSTNIVFGKKDADLLIRLYEELGGKLYSPIGHDAQGRTVYRRKKIGKSTMTKLGLSITRPMDTAENVLSNLQEMIAISDAPPRMADAEAALAEHGFVIRNGSWFNTRTNQAVDSLPESARIAASVAMSEATINFKRIGALGQYVEAFFPFFNATLQATYRQYQQIKNLKSLRSDTPEADKALRFLIYLSALAATGIFYWLMRHDDDDYRNQEAWLRDGYWTWGSDGKTYYRIPKPRDFAIVSNVTENLLDAWSHEDARETSDILMREIGGRIPTGGGLPRALVETYIADYDYFRGRELEGESVKDTPKPYRTSSYTSRMSDYLGQKFGKVLNTSPIQFQHLLNSASGGMYGRLTDTYDAAQDGRLGPEHIPFARGLMIDRRQTRPIGEFYQKKADLEELAGTQAIENKEGVDPEVANKIAHFGWISEVMTKLRKDEAKIGKKRTFENEKYITGLARAALGYKEQESNPNPLTAKDLPPDVRKTMDEYRQAAVVGAAERLGPRSVYKSDETYAKQKTQVERAEARLKMLDMSLEEAKQALKDHWKQTYGSTNEDGRMREALRTRLRKLETLFKPE